MESGAHALLSGGPGNAPANPKFFRARARTHLKVSVVGDNLLLPLPARIGPAFVQVWLVARARRDATARAVLGLAARAAIVHLARWHPCAAETAVLNERAAGGSSGSRSWRGSVSSRWRFNMRQVSRSSLGRS